MSVGARLMVTGISQSCVLVPKAIFVLLGVSSVDEVVAIEVCRRWGLKPKKVVTQLMRLSKLSEFTIVSGVPG